MTNIISAVNAIVFQSKLGGRFITIGHSFGSRILMASTLQGTIAVTRGAHPGRPYASYEAIESLSQAVIFLNPAFEAAYFTPIAAFNRPEERFTIRQKPVLLSIATADDNATTYAFPIGQWLAWRTAVKEISTLGNYEPFWTHSLDEAHGSSCIGPHNADDLTEQYGRGGVCLKRTAGYAHNPFMVVRAEPSILSGHNGIWDHNFSRWLFGYIDELGKQLPTNMTGE